MKTVTLEILQDEYWYGFCVDDGYQFPLHAGSEYRKDINPNRTENQAAPLLLSSAGRSIWCESGFLLTVSEGKLTCDSPVVPLKTADHFDNLRDAYLYVMQNYLRPSGICPPDLFFTAPQYNTWIELLYDQNQADVLSYAQAILDNGYPPGILMIDDGWMLDYGHWEFHPGRFPDPAAMIDSLHRMGFKVMLWTCPFVSPDGRQYLNLQEQGLLLRDVSGETAVREWWNGYSAVLDLTNPAAVAWYDRQNKSLMERYGVDGFKFDAGDGKFYRDDDRTCCPADANDQTCKWAELGLLYPYNEYRAGFKLGGQPLVQRLADKNHDWEENGVASLVPNSLAQGILGYAFTCPDMIGGGQYACFTGDSILLDEELFVRYAQCAALMPMMQFSAAPWRVLAPEFAGLCREAAALHQSFAGEILSAVKQSAVTGEPMIRYMEYQFPHQGMAQVTDQFMLGEYILVAPIWQKGQTSRGVYLPWGQWKYVDGTVYNGGGAVRVNAPLERLPYFIKVQDD